MRYSNKFLPVLVLVAICGSVTAVFKSCSDNSDVSNVLCNGVSSGVCVLKKGQNATLEVDFTPKVSASTLNSVCHGEIGGVSVPFDDIDHNGCDGIKPSCPIQSGKAYKFITSIPVKSIYPSLKLYVKWEEQDKNGKDVFCIEVPAEIQ